MAVGIGDLRFPLHAGVRAVLLLSCSVLGFPVFALFSGFASAKSPVQGGRTQMPSAETPPELPVEVLALMVQHIAGPRERGFPPGAVTSVALVKAKVMSYVIVERRGSHLGASPAPVAFTGRIRAAFTAVWSDLFILPSKTS